MLWQFVSLVAGAGALGFAVVEGNKAGLPGLLKGLIVGLAVGLAFVWLGFSLMRWTASTMRNEEARHSLGQKILAYFCAIYVFVVSWIIAPIVGTYLTRWVVAL